jgi:prefoldin alpha subunit
MADAKLSREDLQSRAVQLEYINQQIRVMESHLSEVAAAVEELSVMKVGLRNMGDAKEGDEILVPLGASSYVTAGLKGPGNVLVSVGAGVFVERPVDEAVPLVDKQIEELRKQEEKVLDNVSVLSQESEKLTRELNEALRGMDV